MEATLISKDNYLQTTVRLPLKLLEQLKREAQDKGYTVKDLIVFILWSYLDNTAQE